jgi:hypothetical protein
VGTDAIGEVFQAGFLFGIPDFPTDGNVICEGNEDEVATWDGNIASDFGSFVGDGLFDDLHQEGFPGFEYLSDFARLHNGLLDGELVKICSAWMSTNGRFNHFTQGLEIWAEIEIGQKPIFFTTYVNEGGIEGWGDFFDFP